MSENERDGLEKRVVRLETLVTELTSKIDQVFSAKQSVKGSQIPFEPEETPRGVVVEPKPVTAQPQTQKIIPPPPPASPFPPAGKAPVPESSFELPEQMKSSEYWLNKIGIGLLLFGAVFLFKYSVEQGWLTPIIRVVTGLVIGGVLCSFGLRLYRKRQHFSRVLLGGAIGTFYITGYAAFQIFQLVSYPMAFTFYVIVTGLSFHLSLKENDFIFSLIAIIGGLGTPFLLYTGESSIPGLMLYLCILLTGASVIYYFKGWWSFFWTTCIGGWVVICIALFGESGISLAPLLDKVSIQSALFLALPFFWLVPLGREVAIVKKSSLQESSISESTEKSGHAVDINLTEMNLILLATVIPFFSFFLSTVLWKWSDFVWGTVSLATALAIAAIGWLLNQKTEFKTLAYTHIVVGLVFLTVALYYFLDGNALLVAITLEGVAIHLVRMKVGNRTLAPIAHSLFGLVSAWILFRLFESQNGSPIINAGTLSDMVVPASALALSYSFKRIKEKHFYLFLGYALLAGIFWRELDGNDLFLTLTLQAASLFYIACRVKNRNLFNAAHVFNTALFFWLLTRLFDPASGTTVFNYTAATDILFIAYGAAVSSFLILREDKIAYLMAAHITLLLWLLREMSPLTNGQGLVSITWGIYTVVLFVIGLRKDVNVVTKTAMATLLVLIGKLFLVDLANLETLWRILLFLGFGGVLLLLSYFFKALWKKDN